MPAGKQVSSAMDVKLELIMKPGFWAIQNSVLIQNNPDGYSLAE